MSILIKGAKKPDHCLLCFAFRGDMCAVAKKEVVLSKGVQEWCPLVDISLHSKLIEVDGIQERIRKDIALAEEALTCDLTPHARLHMQDYIEMDNVFLEMLDDAPTIIGSEEE